jgi:hypothetical protein
MKPKISFCIIFIIMAFSTYGQNHVKATIRLTDGKIIDVYHFGKLVCESNRSAATFTILRGKYNGNHTEIREYKDISKLVLSGFTASPAPSVGNQKGKITAIKKNGVSVPLDEAELVMSCFSPADRYNEIHVQIINPLNEQKTDMAIEMKDIESITF